MRPVHARSRPASRPRAGTVAARVVPAACGALAGLAGLGMLGGCEDRLPLTWPSEAPPSIDSPAGFARLWSSHCAGCHGAEGSLGPARPMNDPLYLATVGDSELARVIRDGSPPGTLMPAFGQSRGGPLAEAEITAIVSGMRRAWGRKETAPSAIPYAADARHGRATRGRELFERSCISCHAHGEVTDPFYLQLVSDQALRSAIIFGRPDLGMPGAAGPFPDRPEHETLSAQDVDDLVAWLLQRRTEDWPPSSIRRGGRP